MRRSVSFAVDATTAEAHLDEAIKAASPAEGWLLSGWVLVAEFVPPVGKPILARIESNNMTPWLRTGMLHDLLFSGEWSEKDGRP